MNELAIYGSSIHDQGMIGLLKEHASSGVRIRVFGSLMDAFDGVTVQLPESSQLHARAIIRDGTRAFVDSQRVQKVELGRGSEIGGLLDNPGVTRQLMQILGSDREQCLHTGGKQQKREAAPR